jgi:hypothetical protein
VVEVFAAQTPDRARLNRPAQIDLKPSSSRTTRYSGGQEEKFTLASLRR